MTDRADVLIVGGGLVGAASAWHLARRGASVILIDKGGINAGASSQNAGSLHFQIERRFLEGNGAAADDVARMVALNRLAVEDWRGLEQVLEADLHVSMAGGLMVAETAAEVAMLEAKVRQETAHGLDVRLVDGDEARRLAPYLSGTILAACHARDEGHADPLLVTPAFAAAALQAGADIRTGQTLVALEKADAGFTARLAGGRILFADQLLVAAGAWSPQLLALLNLHLPLFPVALQMNVTERRPPFIAHLVQHVGRRLSMKQGHAGNVLIGGGWPARLAQSPRGGFDLDRRATLLETSLTGNLRAAVDVVPAVRDLNLIRSWTGITAISADQLPIVGEVARMPGLFVAAGGSAFTLGPTFARLLAARMAGEPVTELALVSPDRFNHLNSFMGQV